MAERGRDVGRLVAREIREEANRVMARDGPGQSMTRKQALQYFRDYFHVERTKINHIFAR
jgi:hypothetical protein